MSGIQSRISTSGELAALVIRADGSHRDCGVLSRMTLDPLVLAKRIVASMPFMERMYHRLRTSKLIPLGMSFAAFMDLYVRGSADGVQLALVTTAGVNYMAADFLSASSSRINAFNYHDSGTGSTAAAIGDTALGTQAGPTTRATGTQSNPTANQYRSVGTISYTSTLSIQEWGLFSQAAQGGTLWDRRVFTSIGVANGDSIQFTYTLTVNAGGS